MNVQTTTSASTGATKVPRAATQPEAGYSLPETGFVREAQLIPNIVPFAHTTLWRKVRNGHFPKPIRISANVTAWRAEDVREWINSRG